MPSGLIHGDFNHRNVLMAGDNLAAVLEARDVPAGATDLRDRCLS
jgi:Ser/Thr protein kinase RdoA (MazF antagonist)